MTSLFLLFSTEDFDYKGIVGTVVSLDLQGLQPGTPVDTQIVPNSVHYVFSYI